MIDKELQALHKLYDKHEVRRVGHAKWTGGYEPVFACSCGKYFYLSDTMSGVKRYEYSCGATAEWLVSTAEGLHGAARIGFQEHMRTKRGVELSSADWLTVYGTPKPEPRWLKAAAKRKRARAAARASAQNGTRI
jgi:hypothetical protein